MFLVSSGGCGSEPQDSLNKERKIYIFSDIGRYPLVTITFGFSGKTVSLHAAVKLKEFLLISSFAQYSSGSGKYLRRVT